MVVTVSHGGYVKRVPLSTYREQARGGKGRAGMQTRDDDFVARLFVASTHTPILFFSSRGQVYKEKVWRMPVANPQSRGKALVNMLPLEQGERITTIMPLPEDEEKWGELDVFFATTSGSVRRNKLSDFTQVNRAGKIAMKLDAGEEIVDVQTCGEASDVLLTTQNGQCIRFAVDEVRVFKGRDSMGVRGIALGKDDRVIALSILQHMEADAGERLAYLKKRRLIVGEVDASVTEAVADEAAEEGIEPDAVQPGSLSDPRFLAMEKAEDLILTIAAKGFGKRTSSYEYRLTRRGGKGIVAMAVNARNGQLVASFPVKDDDGLMLVTNGGQLIRVPVDDIRIVGRGSQGVTVFRTGAGEQVVSVERIRTEVEAAPDGPTPDATPDPMPEED